MATFSLITSGLPPPMLAASAYWATSFSVTFGPPPPIHRLGCGLRTPLGSLIGLSIE